MSLTPKILRLFRPVLEFIDKYFTIPHSIKKMKGMHYYLFRDRIQPGDVFISDINGVGSNLINPSDGKHAAIYAGFNMRIKILDYIANLDDELENIENEMIYVAIANQRARLAKYVEDTDKGPFPIDDDVAYVIEATGKGVVLTDLVEFITSKDKIRCYRFNHPNTQFADNAPLNAIGDLGLPYDFGFAGSNESKYCFEVVADAYTIQNTDRHFKMTDYKIFGKVIHRVYLATTWTEDPHNWKEVINSKSEFPHLY